MNFSQLINKIENGSFSESFELLYNDVNAPKLRYKRAANEFKAIFGEANGEIYLFSAPGRTEVGGNHTDHQHGRVLAGSVNLDVIAVVHPTETGLIRIKSEGYRMDEVDISSLQVKNTEKGRAISLIRGMCNGFLESGYKLGGFDAYTTSNVLKGSGLSSSAAFEVLIGVILNGLYNSNAISSVEIAKLAQRSENMYFGKPCGLMDQMASSVGGFTGMDFYDPHNPIIEKVAFDLSAHNHSLCIVNTGGNHADLTNDYAEITVECKSIAAYFGKTVLRDVDIDEFYSSIFDLRAKCGDRAVLRAVHFFADNETALLEKRALATGDFDGFLRLVNISGNSSYKYLQNVFSPHTPKQQGLSLALALTDKFLGGRGAHRVHGGGFAGTIQCFVPCDMLDKYINMIELAFGKGSCHVLFIRSVGGVPVLEN